MSVCVVARINDSKAGLPEVAINLFLESDRTLATARVIYVEYCALYATTSANWETDGFVADCEERFLFVNVQRCGMGSL